MENKNELAVINEQEVLGKEFKIYGDFDNPLFLAKDVANWIEHNKPNELINNVDSNEKLKAIITHSGQNREMWFLTEDGLYEVLMQSRKPIAKEFKREVKNILKTLRKTGGYISNADLMVNTYFSTIPPEQKMIIGSLFTQIENQQKLIDEQKPLVTFAETCLKSNDNILIRELSKVANDEGVNIGQNRLYSILIIL